MTTEGTSWTMKGDRKYLVWLSTDNAKALQMLSAEPRNYDIMVHDFDGGFWFHIGMAEHYGRLKGEKLATAAKFLPGIFERYRYVAFFDDDIETTSMDVSRMFTIGDALRLPLFQPALTVNSFGSHNHLFQQVRGTIGNWTDDPVRHVPFVEIMVPFFSTAALSLCLPLFDFNMSGWGLDIYDWPQKVNGHTYVLDSIPVAHMREPARRARVLSNGLTPQQELWIAEKVLGPNCGPVNPPVPPDIWPDGLGSTISGAIGVMIPPPPASPL
jgi:hypothetical protein